MTINWTTFFSSIIVLTLMAIRLHFSIKKSAPEKISEEEIKKIKNFIKKPGTYFFTKFAVGFFGVSVVIDVIAVITHSFKMDISYKYLLPLFFAYYLYLELKNASKLYESTDQT